MRLERSIVSESTEFDIAAERFLSLSTVGAGEASIGEPEMRIEGNMSEVGVGRG